MWKKVAVPVSFGVFVLGLVMILISVVSGNSDGDSSSAISVSDDTVTTEVAGVDTTEVLDFSGFSTSTAVTSPVSGQPTPGSIPAGGSSGSPSPTAAAVSSASPTTFALSTIAAPTTPGLPGAGLPSRDSYAPPVTTAPGGGFIVVVDRCSTFQECAQKLYEKWINGGICFESDFGSPFATQGVIDAMVTYCGRIQGSWNPTLVPGAGRNQLVGTSNRTTTPKVIVFTYVAGQSGPTVQSVQIQ